MKLLCAGSRTARTVGAMLVAAAAAASAQEPGPALAGRWQYLQPPDQQGEVLDIAFTGGRWRAVMNGLERTGDHGLFYYVVEPADLVVAADGSISFTVGERALYSRRPPLSRLGGDGSAGVARDVMHFRGQREGEMLVLTCEAAPGACPDAVLRFRRLAR